MKNNRLKKILSGVMAFSLSLSLMPMNIQAAQSNEYVDPADYYFRQHLLFETGDERYQWLNGACCFGVLGCKDDWTIVYDAYMVK